MIDGAGDGNPLTIFEAAEDVVGPPDEVNVNIENEAKADEQVDLADVAPSLIIVFGPNLLPAGKDRAFSCIKFGDILSCMDEEEVA